MVTREIAVVGGSAGALNPLLEILSLLPADLPASLFVVLHSYQSIDRSTGRNPVEMYFVDRYVGGRS